MKLRVKNGLLVLSKQEIANIIRDATNYMIDDEFPEEKKEVLSYQVDIDNDGVDILGKKNVNFSCCDDCSDDRFEGWKQQRIERGFDDTELWNLDGTILSFIIPRLKAFRKEAHGYPGGFNSFEEWISAVDEMIWAMEWYNSDEMHEDYQKDEHGNFLKDENNNLIPTEERQRAMNGWALFCNNFFGLWS